MNQTRLTVHDLLTSFLDNDHCYYQPPESIKLEYPCIIYKYDNNTRFMADDKPYAIAHQFIITFITRDPDDSILDAMFEEPKLRFDRYYVAENLHHYSFIYYLFKKEIVND